MFWHICFWLIAALLFLPLPFKIFEYIKGTDPSPVIVKVEEMANAIFTMVGMIGFYGYLNDEYFFTPLFWQVWLLIAVLNSLLSLFKSPKLIYAKEVMGQTYTQVFMLIGILLYLPLYIAVYFYAF